MSQSKIVGVLDEQISTSKSDALKIGLHSHALVNFIKNTTTLMTIAIQGEWNQKIEKYFKEEQNRKDSIAWLCEAVIIFENIFIELVNKYVKETGVEIR